MFIILFSIIVRCDVGYYGSPETLGSFCQPCDCSGNIDPSRPGSCDSVSGECLQCLNNTFGAACELCAPGFYGDAIASKDCRSKFLLIVAYNISIFYLL